VGDDGRQIGVVKTAEALRYAEERDLDLVEVAPEARPPVCRVLDYSKYKYEQAQKQKAARKHQQQIVIREIKFRPKIARGDYDTKKGHVERFLRAKDKVKVTIMFRGREQAHPERGAALLQKLAGELVEYGIVEQQPTQDGRNMTMMLGPSKAVLAVEEEVVAPVVTAPTPGKTSRRNRLAADQAAAGKGKPAASRQPVEPADEAPDVEAPDVEAPDAEAPDAEAPAEPAAEAPTEPAAEAPTEPAGEAPAESTGAAAVEPAAEASPQATAPASPKSDE